MNREKEFYDLPEWVNVNRVLRSRRKWQEEKVNFDKVSRIEKGEV